MSDTFLQTYLNNQFIKTDETENITRLKKVALEVSKRLTKKKAKIISYTLVALDPLILETDPVISEVEKIIISKWSAFKNNVTKTKEKPTTYVRIVILEALRLLTKEQEFAAIIWHTSRDVISFYNTSREGETLAAFLQKIANDVEVRSQNYWSVHHTIESSSFETASLGAKDVKIPSISPESIARHLLDAAQYTTWARFSKNVGSNPQSPNSQNWAPYFSSKAAEGLAKEINAALSSQGKSLNAMVSSLQEDLKKPLIRVLNEISTSQRLGAVANNKRSELLWWKQTLYSPTLDKSYRSLELVNAAIVMAGDLASMVDPVYPHSVDFLLKETLKDVHGDQIDNPELLSHWLELAANLDESEKALLQYFVDEGEGRKPLITALSNSINGTKEVDVLTETGVTKEAKLSLGDLAVWLFHNFQAAKLAKAK